MLMVLLCVNAVDGVTLVDVADDGAVSWCCRLWYNVDTVNVYVVVTDDNVDTVAVVDNVSAVDIVGAAVEVDSSSDVE